MNLLRKIIGLIVILVAFISNVKLSFSQSTDRKREKYILDRYAGLHVNGRDTSIIEIKKYIKQSEAINSDIGIMRGLVMLQFNAIGEGNYALSEKYAKEAEKLATHRKILRLLLLI